MKETVINLSNLADASFGEQVLALRQLFGLSQKEFGVVLGGVSERTISRWEQSATSEPHAQNKVAVEALRTMAEALGDLFEPEIIKVWVDRANPALGGERPRDYAKKPGGIYRMAALLGAKI
jgi:transcriptional regulator with XRE-family HTH domain